MEDDLRWKTIFDGRQPSMEGNLRWKTTFYGRQPTIEDNLRWKMPFDVKRKRPAIQENYLKIPNELSLNVYEILIVKTVFH